MSFKGSQTKTGGTRETMKQYAIGIFVEYLSETDKKIEQSFSLEIGTISNKISKKSTS